MKSLLEQSLDTLLATSGRARFDSMGTKDAAARAVAVSPGHLLNKIQTGRMLYGGGKGKGAVSAEQAASHQSAEAHLSSRVAHMPTNGAKTENGKDKGQWGHAMAGMQHLKAADAWRAVGTKDGHDKAAAHLEAAQAHAAAAGGEWDEEKHPRDANGMFT